MPALPAAPARGDATEGRWPSSTPLLVGVYGLVVLLSLVQRPGQLTHDTRLELTSDPTGFLAGAFSMWHPATSFGEIQNQAYGYLFPQGLFFALVQQLHVPMWAGQRVWSALLLVLAIEGARRVGLRLGFAAVPALATGVAYGLAPRVVTTDGVISAETLVTTVLPWVVLPLMLLLDGRVTARRAVVLSAVALLFTGGVNAAENLAILPLPFLILAWAVTTRRLSVRVLLGWCAAVVVATAWWLLPLLASSAYALPFYDFVESARNTTSIAGWSESVRGTTHWVGYLVVGNQPWWPAGWALSTTTTLTLVTAAVGAVGLVGLGRLDRAVRTPLVLSALVGFVCIAIPHGTWAGGPLSTPLREALDGTLAVFRNVHKADPLIRLPLAIGFGHVVEVFARRALSQRSRPWTVVPSVSAVALLVVVALAGGLPLMNNQMRTPGWHSGSDADWEATARYLQDHPQGRRTVTLVVPGAAFATNVWGWTIEEPFVESARTPWATRSQIPLSTGQNIRFLDGVQDLIGDASGTSALGPALARAGVGYVVLRDDLDQQLTETPSPATFEASMAQAGGLTKQASFGDLTVWRVSEELPKVRVTATSRVQTVQGGPGDVVRALSSGALDPGGAAVVAGEDHWREPVDLVTDGNVRLERAFGRIYDAVSAPMGPRDSFRTPRPYHDYPGAPGARPVVARYDSLASLTASSSAGYADSFGAVRPEFGPYAAVDFSEDSQWVSSAAAKANDQWVQLKLKKPRKLRTLTISATVTDRALIPVRQLRVVTDGESKVVRVDPVTGEAVARLSGKAVRNVRVEVESTAGGKSIGPVGVRDIRIPGLVLARTLVVPAERQAADPTILLGTSRESRACVPADLGPDCDTSRIRASSETLGMDRTVHLDAADSWSWRGTAVARTRAAAAALLNPLGNEQQVRASSVYGDDPAVSPRMAYDGRPGTSWRSATGDSFPTLQFDWSRPQRISELQVESNEDAASAPRTVLLRTRAGVTRRLTLDGSGLVRFSPVRAKEVTLTFGGSGDSGVAVSEVRFPSGPDVTRLLVESGPTGAQCGLGPEIFVDGVPHPTSVSGTIRDVVNGTPLDVRMCKSPVKVDAGWHRVQVRSTEEFQVTSIVDDARGVGRGAVQPSGDVDTVPDRSVTIERWTDSARRVRVGPGERSVVNIPENFNVGWRARSAGKDLPSLQVDGWQQGWVLPSSTAARDVDITFRGQTAYLVALSIGGALALALLVGTALVLRSERRNPPTAVARRAVQAEVSRRARRARRLGGVVLLAVAAPWVAAGVLVGWAPLRSVRSFVLPLVLLLGAASMDVAGLPFFWTVVADAMTAVGIGCALAPALRRVDP